MSNNRRSKLQWRGLLSKQSTSGLSVAEFCHREQLSTASFYQWRKRLLAEEQNSEVFVPLTVSSAAAVEVELPGGAVLRVPPGDERTLEQVVSLLMSRESTSS